MERQGNEYVRRTQKDYSMSFKLQVVDEVEAGRLSISQASRKYGIQGSDTVKRWIEKYGNLGQAYQLRSKMRTPEQEILALRQKIKELERQNKRLSKELEHSDQKASFFDLMIDIAEEEFKIPIRKKSVGDALKYSKKGDQKSV